MASSQRSVWPFVLQAAEASGEDPVLVFPDVAVTVITEGNLGCGEEMTEASHEEALMLGSDPW